LKNFFNKYKNFLLITFLGVFSLVFNFYYGYRGVYPIDSFTTFDSSYNIILGNHPFKDYWLITGPFLNYIQSLFFLIFGINWISYVLHASTMNMLLAIFSYYFFSKIGLNIFYAFIYSLGISILAYPSIGTPFADHHAVILSILSMYSLFLGIFFKKNFFWFITPLLIVFAFFSKQIPAAYIGILFGVVIFYYFFVEKSMSKKNFLYLCAGFLFSVLLISSVFLINEIPIKNFLTQYIYYPLSLGEKRFSDLNLDYGNFFGQFKFIFFSLIPLVVSLIIIINKKENKLFKNKNFVIGIIFIFLVLIFIYFQLMTLNQILIFSLIPISLAFSHVYIEKYYNKKYLIYFIIILFIFSIGKYHIRFNENKKFMELSGVDFNLAVNGNNLDKIFSGLKWITPHYANEPEKEIDLLLDSINYLSNVNERKNIITDYQFFSILLKNPFASPNKFYDGQGIPGKKNKYYNKHKDFFLEKIKTNKIQYLYFVGNNKHEIDFFVDFINENECIESSQINELLIELNITGCDF